MILSFQSFNGINNSIIAPLWDLNRDNIAIFKKIGLEHHHHHLTTSQQSTPHMRCSTCYCCHCYQQLLHIIFYYTSIKRLLHSDSARVPLKFDSYRVRASKFRITCLRCRSFLFFPPSSSSFSSRSIFDLAHFKTFHVINLVAIYQPSEGITRMQNSIFDENNHFVSINCEAYMRCYDAHFTWKRMEAKEICIFIHGFGSVHMRRIHKILEFD